MPVIKNFLNTKNGRISYVDAVKIHEISRKQIYYRKSRGWSDDQVCGIDSPPEFIRDRSEKSYVYGWFSEFHGIIIYVGLTVQGIKERTYAHLRDAKLGSSTVLAQMVRAHGEGNFHVIELWTGTVGESSGAERAMIEKHKTSVENGGANVMPGGSLGSNLGRRVEYNGKVYDSIEAVWRDSDSKIGVGAFRERLKRGMSIQEALDGVSRERAIVVNGTSYPSIKAAWEAESDGSISLELFRDRVGNRGEHPEEALRGKALSANRHAVSLVVNGVVEVFSSKKDAWISLGNTLSYTAFKARLFRGLSVGEALGYEEVKNG